MKFERHYTKDARYGGVVFVPRVSVLKEAASAGVTVNVTAPERWSQTAVDILVQKYFRRAGVPNRISRVPEDGVPQWLERCAPAEGATFGGETDARQVFARIAGCWAYWGWKGGYFTAEADALIFYEEIIAMLALQIAAPASPQWFGTGLFWAYGIEGPSQGHYAITALGNTDNKSYDYFEIGPCRNAYERPQASACFLNSVEDSLLGAGGILDLAAREARVFKFGSGSGSNASKLRGAGEPLSGGGRSSGLLSWLKGYDRFAGAIKSGGTVRRAAKLVTLDLDHPDIEEYIDWKVGEENKVAAMAVGSVLINRHAQQIAEAWKGHENAEFLKAVKAARRAGIPAGMVERIVGLVRQDAEVGVREIGLGYEEEGYETVSGQNANNSVRATDAFMRKATGLDPDPSWPLHWRTELIKAEAEGRDPVPHRTVNAADLWRDINQASWTCADPGVQFDTTINDWNTCAEDGRITTANPCCLVGETLVDTSEGRIPISRLEEMSRTGQTLPMAFAYDPDNRKPVLRKIMRAWVAGAASNLIRVTTDKGVEILCTPEHRFLTYQGGYVRADRLSVGTSLRKIARHANIRRSGRILIADRTCGTSRGIQYQNIWMWEQAHGPIPEGHEIHHKNGDASDDRMGNLECVSSVEHHKMHSVGSANPRFLEPTDAQLVEVWDWLMARPNQKGGDRVTCGRWNRAVRLLGLLGVVPLANGCGRIQGVKWTDFVSRVSSLRESANDRVAKVERVIPDSKVVVYDLEVEGVHNFAVTNREGRSDATIVVHNSEYNFLDNTGCNLASSRLTAFSNAPNDFDVAAFRHVNRLLTVALDITVTMAGYPSEAIAKGSANYRTLGLGYCDLGAMLMRWGVPYDSQIGRVIAASVTALMHFVSVETSVELASDLGAFPRYGANEKHVRRVLENHYAAVNEDCETAGLSIQPRRLSGRHHLVTAAKDAAESAMNAYYVSDRGVRNAQWTLLAPTGTIGLLMDADTTGVEPDFALVKHKKLAGGGYFRITNQSVRPALAALFYKADEIDRIENWLTVNMTVEGCPDLQERDLPVFDCANRCGANGTRSLTPDSHVLMLAAVQPFLSGAVSKTINMPSDATIADFARVTELAWHGMVKAVALYRDGSKLSQPLSSAGLDESSNEEEAVEPIQTRHGREALPDRRRGDTQKFRIGGHKFYLRTGEYADGRLGEIFLTATGEGSSYRAIVDAWAMAVSIGLQYGVPLSEFVDAFAFSRFEPNGPVGGHARLKNATSVLDAVVRDLAIRYAGRDDLAHTPAPDAAPPTNDHPATPSAPNGDAAMIARQQGYDPVPCRHCGVWKMRRHGKCLVCDECGTADGGCS